MAVDNNGSRSQASKMFDLAMDLDEQVSHMMNELEQVQDTLAKLLALYPESLSYALTWTTPTDSPRFKNLERQRLYIFRRRKGSDRSAWKIKPAGYADDESVIQQWDEILRLIATIKLKEVTASDLFRRLNSYSKQLSVGQRHEVDRLTEQVGRCRIVIDSILSLAEQLKQGTIEKVLAKSDLELGLEFLLSKGKPRR